MSILQKSRCPLAKECICEIEDLFRKTDEQEDFTLGVMIKILINIKGLDYILSHYGIRHQIRKFAEEAYELQEAVIEQETLQEFTEQKGNFDNEHIAEELADVMVLWMQIRMHYNVNIDKIEGIVNEKIKRQIKRIEDETSSI